MHASVSCWLTQFNAPLSSCCSDLALRLRKCFSYEKIFALLAITAKNSHLLLCTSILLYHPSPSNCPLILLPITHPQHSPSYSTSSHFLHPQQSPSQPGLQRMVLRLEDLIRRIDSDLHHRFEEEGVQFMQFSFRWYVLLLSLVILLCLNLFTLTLRPFLTARLLNS